jgi:hypothetical protein
MSETKPAPSEQNVELVLANTVSRLGCTVAQAREFLAKQTAAAQAPTLTPATPAQPTSKGGTAGDGEALL